MQDRWNRLKQWLEEENGDVMLEELEPPATEAELDEAEAEIGLEFPPSVRESYLVHDGMDSHRSPFHVWRPLPLEEVVSQADGMAGIGEQFGYDCWDPTVAIPIMANGSGDLVYVEHAPDGEETPVTSWNHETHANDELAPSFAALFDLLLEGIDAGNYSYEEGSYSLTYDGAESPLSLW